MSPTAMTFLIFLVLTFTTTSTSATFIPQTPTGYFARLPANLTADYNPPLNIYQKNEFLYTDCHPHQFFSWRLVSEPTSGRLYKQLFSPVNCEPYTTYMPSHRDDYIRVTMAYFNVSGHIIEVHMPEEYTSSKRPVTDGIELVSSFYLKDDVLYDLAQSLGILEYGGRLTFAMEYFSITKNDPMEEEEETTKEESPVLTLKPMFSHA